MATTATITLTSADIAGDPVNVSKTMTCTKAGATTDLDQSTGLNRVHLRSTTQKTLFTGNAEGNDLAAKVYIINKAIDPTLYVSVAIAGQSIGKLYAGDWMFIPWGAEHADSDIGLEAQTGTNKITYTLFHEGRTLTAS